ncbi:MAG: hypothetical protein WB766_11830 [Roseiarcus sp.]
MRFLVKEKPKKCAPKAFKYYYIPATPIGVAGIVMDPTEDLHWLQDELIKAVEPYAVTFQGSRNDRFGSLGSEYVAIGCTGFSAPSGRRARLAHGAPSASSESASDSRSAVTRSR